MNEIQEKIIYILINKIETDNAADNIGLNDDLSELGINSMSFIKLIVEIEGTFDIEFLDDELDFTYLNTISNISEYIERKLSGNNNL